MKIQCPVCSREVEVINPNGLAAINCRFCGDYQVENLNTFTTKVLGWTPEQRINLSGWIRENPNCKISNSLLENLARMRNLTVGERAEKILSQLAKKFPKPGEWLDLSNNAHLEFMAIGRAASNNELEFLLYEFLHGETELLLVHELDSNLGVDRTYKISPKGWAYLESLRHGNPDSQIGFIAMWFDQSMNEPWKAIDAGIRAAGYDPLRIDQKQHNNKIDDEIVAAIRRSKFVVADFTKQRGGVYFEAGFAKGLNLEVVWLCRQDDLKEVHFDTRQYNFIVWEADKLEELSKTLKDRIEAKFGHGPARATT